MARGVARGIRGGQGKRAINADDRYGRPENRVARKRSKAQGSQRQSVTPATGMARGVARGIRGEQGTRTINARTGNDANRIARKRSKARGSQRQAERLYRQNRADQRANRLGMKGVDIRRGRVSNPVGGNLNAATGKPARQIDRVLVTPAPATGNAGGGKKSSDNSKNKGSRTTASVPGPAPAVRTGG